MFKSRSILVKMLVTSLLLVGFLVAIGFTGIFALVKVSEKYEHVALINMPNYENLNEMDKSVLEISRSFLRIAIPGSSAEEVAKRVGIIKESIATYEKRDQSYRSIPFVAGEELLYEELNKHWLVYLKAVKQDIELLNEARGREKMQKEVETTLSALRGHHGEALKKLMEFQQAESKSWVNQAQMTSDLFRKITAASVLAGMLIALTLAYLSARALSKSLGSISLQIAESGSQVRSASEQLSVASQQLSSGATQAASALEETVASVEELTSMVKLNADNAREASGLSQNSRKSAEDGESEITKLNVAIHEIAQSSKRIEEIINVIDDIAFQTNLLALNAAVEAARAGEQGKGFAVVAEAVRTLAQRSASAAKDITALIKESVQKIERGEKMADESRSVLKNIVVSVTKVAALNNEIATASQEQSHGLLQISKAMNELDQATQRNASSAEETAASSEEMSGQAGSLEVLVHELNNIIEGSKKAKNQENNAPSSKHTQESVNRSAHSQSSHTRVASVTPLNRSKNVDAKKVLPLDNEEVRNRKVGSIDGF